MSPNEFVYLHNHSHFSLLEALPKVKGLVKRAKELGMTALALTDNGNMYGAVDFYKACKEAEIKAILGCDLYVAQHTRFDKRPRVDDRPYRLVVLVQNEVGYRNLCSLVSQAFLEGFYYKPRVDKELLKKHASGLIALSGSANGEIPHALGYDDTAKAIGLVKEYQEIFGEDNFYLELINHPDFPRQIEINQKLIALSKATGAPLVAARNTFYLDPEDREGYEAQLCIQRSKTLEEFRRTATDEVDLSFGTPEEIIEAFKDHPEALENTKKIADRVDFALELGKNFLPIYPLPPGKTDNDVVHDLCIEGLKKRYSDPIPANILERFEFEFSTIVKMGFSSYFLIVQDYINWAKDNGVLVGPGRGSAAGSIVAYALHITDIDPMRYGLLFERFLNPDRASMPDIDTDFADSGRARVLEYVTARYGADKVAGIITYGTLMPRAAVRDAARVLGLSFQEGDQIAKVIPPPIQGKHTPLKIAVLESPDLKVLYDSSPVAHRVIDLAMKLEGNPRHASQHACGIVIGDRPLVERVPLQAGQHEDMAMITQYSLNSAEAVGLVKMDFLGLANLTIIEDALKIIEAVEGVKIEIDSIPDSDKPTFDLLGRGDTTGVFQLESDGMKRYIRELQPTQFEDIIAMVSLYRPGPMQFIDSFIRRKHGLEQVVYEHPLMENAFKETYGIPVYQEQVMQVSKDLSGFTGGEADSLRKAMGKKIAELMAKMKQKFIDGAVKNGVKDTVAEKIFQKLEDFAAYGFNKSHAACYALIAYRTAYLKAHYPSCFMAALMNSDAGNIDRITIEVEECERVGLKVLPPDVNESFAGFAVVKGTNNIRWGLMAIKNVGTEVAESIVRERKTGGPFHNLADFLGRIKSHAFNKKTIEALIKSGALDRFGDRSTMFANIESLVDFNKESQLELERNQSSLFDLGGENNIKIQKLELPTATPYPKSLILAWEKELLGLYISEHPASLFFKEFLAAGAFSIKDAHRLPDGQVIKISGVISAVKQIFTKKKNEPMSFVRVEDPTGPIETVFFPKSYAKYRHLLIEGNFALITGKVSARERGAPQDIEEAEAEGEDRKEERSILVDDLIIFTESQVNQVVNAVRSGSPESFTASAGSFPNQSANDDGSQITVLFAKRPDQESVTKLREIFVGNPGKAKVFLQIADESGGVKKIMTEYSISPTQKTVRDLEGIVGKDCVLVSYDVV